MINNVWILIGKKFSGEASPEELLELEELLQQGRGEQYPLRLIGEIWENEHQNVSDDKILNTWEAFEVKLDAADKNETEGATKVADINAGNAKQKVIKFIKHASWLVAASLILGVFLFTRYSDTVNNKPNEISAPKNGISKIQLPDGTKVWLNSGSKLAYGNDFGTDVRKVSLVGEAFFDVVKDAKHPFIVTTPTISIRVLGTRFNLRSYKNDKTSEAALLRGQIELTVLRNPEKKIILKPSEKLTVINNENVAGKANKQQANVGEETPLIALSRIHQAKQDTLPSEALWLENKLAFDAEDFEGLAKKLERRYNVSIVFDNEKVKKLRFTGKFQNEPINKALKALQTTTNFHYKINNNQIVIH